jgi:hypothetical protein
MDVNTLPDIEHAVLVRMSSGCGIHKVVSGYVETNEGLFVSFTDSPNLYIPVFPDLFIHDFGGVA